MKAIDISLKRIAEIVAADYGINFTKLVKTKRTHALVRYTYVYLAKELTNAQDIEIGQLIERNQKFVAKAYRKAADSVHWNGDYSNDIEHIKSLISLEVAA